MPGIPFTKVIPGNGTDTLTFEVPSYYAVDLESVLAHVDASGSGDATATLTVADETGEDVATVPQGRTVAGGGTGRATWALRLAAEQEASSGGSGIQFDIDNIGGFLHVFTNGNDGGGIPNGIWLDTSLDPTARNLISSGRDVELDADRDINLTADGDITAIAQGTAILRSAASNLSLRGVTDISVNCSNGGITLRGQNGETAVIIAPGQSFTCYDSIGNPVFRVNESGALQGLTGQSLTFNL